MSVFPTPTPKPLFLVSEKLKPKPTPTSFAVDISTPTPKPKLTPDILVSVAIRRLTNAYCLKIKLKCVFPAYVRMYSPIHHSSVFGLGSFGL
jgi:hypothetical protein